MSGTRIEQNTSGTTKPLVMNAPATNPETEFASVVQLAGEHNYDAWLKSITEFCQFHGLSSHLDGTAVKPDFNKRSRKGTREERLKAYNELLEIYEKKEEKLRDVIVHTTKAVAPYAYGWYKEYYILPNQEILKEVKTMCCEPSASNRTAAMGIFLNLEPKGSAQSFFAELDTLLDRIRVRYGINLADEIRIPYVLAKLSLDPAYMMKNCTGWEALQDKDLSYNDLVGMCLKQDKVLPLVAAPGEAGQTYAERY